MLIKAVYVTDEEPEAVFAAVLQNKCFLKFYKLYGKTSVLESRFNNAEMQVVIQIRISDPADMKGFFEKIVKSYI